MAYTQENRLITIDTPLGPDVLLLTGFRGKEGLSIPFSFELDLISENHSIAFPDIIGKNVTVSIVLADGEKRYFNGIVSRFSQGSGGGEAGGNPHFSYYAATMVPWFWLLTRTADSRIFQKLSVPDIVEKIFGEKGFSDYKVLLDGSYEKRDYCVQYRETDFNFISRLLEEEGLFYFFEHEQGKHTLVLADAPDKHKPCPKQETARYQISAGGWLEDDVITGLEWMQEIQAGKYTLKDFNFEIPGTDLKVEVPSQQTLGPGEREIYDYPGEYGKRAEGERLANIRMQEHEASITTVTGSSVCRAFTSGCRFDLQDYYRDDMNNKPYVLTSLGHEATEPVGTSGLESEASYTNNFVCIPFDVPYRPSRLTPKPVVQGTQTAIVVGPSGEEIYTDEYGRVKVQFHWDREGKKDENSSCWIRVSQAWAGQGWGAMHIPHIGHEVIVDFIEGDPDRPIITGRVYHGANMPADALPGEKTKSSIRDYGGNEQIVEGKDGAQSIHTKQSCGNEFLMDGSSGGEKIELRDKYGNEVVLDAVAGKIRIYSPTHDSEIVLGNSITIFTHSFKTETVEGDSTENVKGNKNEHFLGDLNVKVGADITELYIGGESKQTLGWRSRFVGGWKQENILGAETKTIRGAKKEQIFGTVFKRHVGHEYKKQDLGLKEKSPSTFRMANESISAYKRDKKKIEGERKLEVAGKNMEIIHQNEAKYDEFYLSADKEVSEYGRQQIKIEGNRRLKVIKDIEKAETIIKEANEMKLKGTIKLG